jgi:hypothetical protein
MTQHQVQVGAGNEVAKLQRIKAQLRRALPQLKGQAAKAKPAKVAKPQTLLPPPPPSRSPALPRDEVLLQPPAPLAGPQAAPKSSECKDRVALLAMHGTLAVAVDTISDLKVAVARLQAQVSEKNRSTGRDPELMQSQTQAPSAPHDCDVTLVFEGVPGITAGMGARDARSKIADVLTHTLHIPDVELWSFAIHRVSKSTVLRPVVAVRVQERKLLSNIFASKTSKLMGRGCPIHIFTSQPPCVRPRSDSTRRRQRSPRRGKPAVVDPKPAAAAVAAAEEAVAAATRAMRHLKVAAVGLEPNSSAHAPSSPCPAPPLLNPSTLSPLTPCFRPIALPRALAPAFTSVAEPVLHDTAFTSQDGCTIPLASPSHPVVPDPPPAR